MPVYEFIPNGILSQKIHGKNKGFHLQLETCIKIAQELAEALACLHYFASPPIHHGDVKSSNILLNENYTAKVSDFGASIFAPTSESQFVTFVQGTCGYLDPEYLITCQLADKSDIFNFDVVLLELLIGILLIYFDRPKDEKALLRVFSLCYKNIIGNKKYCSENIPFNFEIPIMFDKPKFFVASLVS